MNTNRSYINIRLYEKFIQKIISLITFYKFYWKIQLLNILTFSWLNLILLIFWKINIQFCINVFYLILLNYYQEYLIKFVYYLINP